ncbi:hypothetical protein ABIQ69_00890 [Agromyces sp. G08B096]|uniref:SpaA-like prealbumin fold domain-containing protein n=1 Tax=Agromyces sp. G08B096 TaxID=3156399 RepID=A0AAU7W7P7_9MICO
MHARRRTMRAAAAAIAVALVGGGILAASSPAAAAGEARLSLFKRIENLDTGASFGDRGAWDVQAVNVETGETFRGQGLNGIQSEVVPAGTYVISEIETELTPPGYRFVNWDCGSLGVFTDPTPTVTLAEDAQVTCTVENVAVQSTLTLVKEVRGGTAPASRWTLHAQGPTNVVGTTGVQADVRIGEYRLSESNGGSGYTSLGWTCVDATSGEDVPVADGDVIEVGLDQQITCTVVNSAQLPQLTLVKEVTGPAGAPLDDPAAWTLTADGPTAGISGASGSHEVSHVGVAPGTYELAEDGPAGYAAGEWTCVDHVSGQPVPVTAGAVEVAGAVDVVCTIVNDFTGGWLTLEKVVVGAQPPTAWTLSATSTDDSIAGVTGTPEVTRTPVAAGEFALAESGPTLGYTTAGWDCSNSDGFVTAATVAAGEEVVCRIENDAVQPHLSLVKQVVNGGGGTLVPGDWTLSAAGPTAVSGAGGSDAVTFVAVDPGAYTLSESSAAADAALYSAGEWQCVLDDTGEIVSTGDVVEVPPGDESVTCTVVNRWTQSTLTLRKQLLAEFGFPDAPTDWTLTATSDASSFSGAMDEPSVTRVPVPAGSTWTLSEDGPAGYESLGWTCSGTTRVDDDTFTVTGGVDAMCQVTNAAIAPRITLVKELVDAPGSTATVADFTLKTRGPGNAAFAGLSATPGVTNLVTPTGEYVFSEDGPQGYDVSWDCTGTSFDPATETATLRYGDVAICTATNTPIPPTLALQKVVQGGTATAADWTLSATGTSGTIAGAGGVPATEVDAGVHVLAETPTGPGTADYLLGAWVCTGEGFDPVVVPVGSVPAIELPLGVDVTCAATNVYTPPVLTLVKVVDDGPDGPGGVPSNWVVSAEGQGEAGGTDVSGAGGSPDIVAQPVTAGSYLLGEAVNPDAPPPSIDYAATEWTCTGTGFDAADLDGDILALEAGDDVTCTVTNVFDPPRLTLVKEVVGGELSAEDWTLSWTEVDDPARTGSGVTGDPAVTAYPVEDGTFRLAEASDAAGADEYAASEWSCDGGEFEAPDLVMLVAEDVSVTCTITNTHEDAPQPTPPVGPPGGGGSDGGSDGDSGGGSGGLAGTGVEPWLALAAAVMLAATGAGLAATGLARRRRRV